MSATAGNEAQNIEIMRRGYEAFANGDIETLKTLFSANANWNQTETGVLPGNYRGVNGILEYFGQLAHESQGSLRVERPGDGARRAIAYSFWNESPARGRAKR